MADNYDRKAELIAELNRARSRATAFKQAGQKRPSVGQQAQSNISRNRVAWLMGSVLIGFIVAKLPPRTKKVVVDTRGRKQKYGSADPVQSAGKAGMLIALVKLILDMTKPIIMAWATKRLGQVLHTQKEVKAKVEKVDRKT